MKKIFAVLTIGALLLSGCSMQQIKGEVKEEINDAKEDISEIMPSQGSHADESEFIGEARAKELALAKADITDEDVIFDRVELENDGGVWKYEVEFKKGTTEYDADISATDGKIISWSVDND